MNDIKTYEEEIYKKINIINSGIVKDILRITTNKEITEKLEEKTNLDDLDWYERESIVSDIYIDLKEQFPKELDDLYNSIWLKSKYSEFVRVEINDLEAIEQTIQDDIKEVVDTFTEEEKVEIAKEKITSSKYRLQIANSLKDDNKKVELINMLENDADKISIIRTLESDDIKLNYLAQFKDEGNKLWIIITIQDDSKKLRQLKYFSNKWDKEAILESLQSDDLKSLLINDEKIIELDETTQQIIKSELQDEEIKSAIINSLKDDNKKIEFLDLLQDEKLKAQVISSLKEDDKKMLALKDVHEVQNQSIIIKELKNDNIKIEFIDSIDNNNKLKLDILSTLSNDELKLNQINKFSNEKDKTQIIESIKNDNLKILQIQEITDKALRLDIMKSVKDDNLKITQIENLQDFDSKVELIKSLNSDNEKLKFIDSIKDKNTKISIIKSISDDIKQYKAIMKYTDIQKNINNLDDKQYNSKELELPQELTLGIELETEGVSYKNANRLARYTNTKRNILEKWDIVEDSSLNNGAEFVSPILNSSNESMKQLDFICDFAKTIQEEVNDNCGFHIHYGVEDFFSGLNEQDYLKAWENFLTLYRESEEIIFKMSNEEGEVPRESISTFATNQSSHFEKIYGKNNVEINSKEDLNKIIDELKEASKYTALNFVNLGNPNKNTVEFRIPNGTLDSDTIKETTMLVGKSIEIAKQLIYDKDLQEKFEVFKKHDLTEAEKEELLLNVLFEDESSREIYRNRFESVKDKDFFDDIKAEKQTFERGNYEVRPEISEILTEVINKSTNNISTKEKERAKNHMYKNMKDLEIEYTNEQRRD